MRPIYNGENSFLLVCTKRVVARTFWTAYFIMCFTKATGKIAYVQPEQVKQSVSSFYLFFDMHVFFKNAIKSCSYELNSQASVHR